MSQQDVYNYLKKNRNKWSTTREMSKEIGITLCNINKAVYKMYKSKEVKRIRCLIPWEKESILRGSGKSFAYAYKLTR